MTGHEGEIEHGSSGESIVFSRPEGSLRSLITGCRRASLADKVPHCVGGGIGQSRTDQYLLRKAALGECSVTVWPEELHRICAQRNIHLLR
ncbi:MAG: hypothetical protein ACYTDX_03060 [Planctomycetota bacterium]